MTTFSATAHQNVYLPRGTSAVHAILAVSARPEGPDGSAVASDAAEVIMLDCSGSMGNPWTKMEAARHATAKAIDRLRDGTWFAVVAGTSHARLVYPDSRTPAGEQVPALARATPETRAAARAAVGHATAGGGTAISNWMALARGLFQTRPGGINHALLLTDGMDEGEDRDRLMVELDRCLGLFQCDCRGFGTDWDPNELQAISNALLGTTDIIPQPEHLEAEFEKIIRQAMNRRIGAVAMQVLSPVGARIRFFKQVSPEVLDLTDRVSRQQPADVGWAPATAVDPGRPLLSIYPTGAWSEHEDREYHLCVTVVPQEAGPEHEVRAGRVALVSGGRTLARTAVRACWTDDAERTTRIDRTVAHYTGQEELAASIEEGLAARRAGDQLTATQRLGRAVQIAAASDNQQTTRLLLRVVDVEDAEQGTVRLRTDVSKEDEMTLDTRSRRTVRLNPQQPR